MLIASFLRGGVGGILIGLVFGIHSTTFLSLLIPSVTSSQPLKPAAFLSVWLLSSIVTSIAAGKWKYFALVASGFCGGASLALATSVTIHPSLLTRIVLVAVFASSLAVLSPLPIAHLQSAVLRTSSSAVGSFGLVLSIALFSRVEPWSNVWERLWVHNDILWGSAQEKGLSAGFFLFLASGICTDYWLRSKLGENPDQKWDSYLAQYVASLPAENTRTGIFHPFPSIWNNLPFRYPGLEPVTLPGVPREKDTGHLPEDRRDQWTRGGQILKTKTRGNVRFRPLDDEDSTDSETEVGDAGHPNLHPWLAGAGSAASTHSLTPTVLEDGVRPCFTDEKKPSSTSSRTLPSTDLEVLDLPGYSDHEVDITSDVKSARDGPDWTPQVFRKKVERLESQTAHARIPLPSDGPSQKNPGNLSRRHESPRWQAFWRDVNERIQRKEVL